MKNLKFTFFIFAFLAISLKVYSQDTTLIEKKEKIKKGLTLGLLPAVAFDSDLGLKYGGLINLYNFGDGSTYPNYKHSIYLEVARTTKGSGQNQLFFDSGHLFKGKPIRLTADLSFLTEQALDFYGFNGVQSIYHPKFEDKNSNDYISRMFYRHERKMIRSYADFQGNITSKKFRWLAGAAFYNYKIGSVDIQKLNEGKDADDLLPDVPTLYDHYVEWGIIPEKEADGGSLKMLKLGLIYDTRDIEANPSRGVWSEAIIMTAPSFLANNENAFTKLSLVHRQYFTLLKDRLTFVYRLGLQTTISGDAPFYFQPMMISSYSPSTLTEGLGGAKSLRGVLRNRIVGDGFTYGNFEFRYKFIKFNKFNQNIYLALNPFIDAGTIIKEIDLSELNLKPGITAPHFNNTKDVLHFTAGCGFHIALNENFVLAINYGRAFSQFDGKSGLYIGTNWLF